MRFRASMPAVPQAFYQNEFWKIRLDAWQVEQGKSAMRFFLTHEAVIIGHVFVDNIVYGAFRAGYLGYGICVDFEGQGHMSRAINTCVRHLFAPSMSLNRVMAACMPDNTRSIHLLRRLGFDQEGYARRYLKLDNRWQDHLLFALINADFFTEVQCSNT